MWKVVYSESDQAAIALIQINNPWAKVGKKDLLCENICDKINWLLLTEDQASVPKKGYTYCCDVNAFRSKVQIVPKFNYSTILNTAETSSEDTSEYDDSQNLDEQAYKDVLEID